MAWRGNQSRAGSKAMAPVAMRNTLLKGEQANIAAGVEGMSTARQLINTAREEVRNAKNDLRTPEAGYAFVLSKLPPNGVITNTFKSLRAPLDRDYENAATGGCVDATELSDEVEELIDQRLPPYASRSLFFRALGTNLSAMPSRFRSVNMQVEAAVKNHGVKETASSHLRLSSSGTYGDGSDSFLNSLIDMRDRQESRFKSYVLERDEQEKKLSAEIVASSLQVNEATATEFRASSEVGSFKANNPVPAPPPAPAVPTAPTAEETAAATAAAAAAANRAARLKELEDAHVKVAAELTLTKARLKAQREALVKYKEESEVGISDLTGKVNQFSRAVQEYKKGTKDTGEAPLLLHEIKYQGDDG